MVVALFAATSAQSPDIRSRVDAYVKALSSGSTERFEAMAAENFAPELLARGPEQRAAMVARVRDEFGELSIADERIAGPTHAELRMESKTNSMPLTILIDLEPNAPFRIVKVEIRAGGPAGGRGGNDGPPPGPAPPINPKMADAELASALDAYLAGQVRSNEFAGVVLLARDGKPLLEKAYGVADRERGTAMAADLRFNLASIGKAFTKTAVGQLIAAGKLKQTDTIGSLLPDYPNGDARPATVAQLLTMRGGISDFFGERFAGEPKARFQSNHDYYTFVAPLPLTFPPGARTQYCNGCYVVLGEIIEKVSGAPFERYVQEHVFTPAGMKTAGYLAFGDPHVALGYTRRSAGDPWTSAVDMHGHHGSAAGGPYATVRDLLAFDTAIRTHVLLDAQTTAWFFDNPVDATSARAMDGYAIAGGAPGANASLESNGTWTVVTLGNLDPPNATRIGTAIARALYGG